MCLSRLPFVFTAIWKIMKTLYVMRHAKSSWDDPDSSDFDRALNARGLRTAPLMGEMMLKNAFAPQMILSSPAKRAKQTAVLVKETARIENEIEFDERIYEASPLSLLQIISEQSDEIESLMLVGHNPGLEGLIRCLTGELEAMPTAALGVIDLKLQSWSEITTGKSGTLRALIRPKDDLKSLGSAN